jgi:hypothetical protein
MNIFENNKFGAFHMTGVPGFKAGEAVIVLNKTDIEFKQVTGMLKIVKWSIPKSDVVSVEFDKQEGRSGAGAVTGAVVGGILTGGVGALVGAAVGGRNKTSGDIFILCRHQATEINIHFKSGKNTVELYNRLMTWKT